MRLFYTLQTQAHHTHTHSTQHTAHNIQPTTFTMRISAVLAFASFAFAAPSQIIEKRQNTALGTVVTAINTLNDATQANFQAISMSSQPKP